jgi:hypothetical protein
LASADFLVVFATGMRRAGFGAAAVFLALDFGAAAFCAVGFRLAGAFIPLIPGIAAIALFAESARAAESRCCLLCCASTGRSAMKQQTKPALASKVTRPSRPIGLLKYIAHPK